MNKPVVLTVLILIQACVANFGWAKPVNQFEKSTIVKTCDEDPGDDDHFE